MRKGITGGRCALALLALMCAAAASAEPGQLRGKAVVRDGDSLEIGAQRVRLWGVDAPEYRQSCRRDGQRWACGRAATQALREHLDGRVLSCEVVDRDSHDRAVARCTRAGRSVNEWLVREGWAVDYARYSQHRYAQAQAQAQRAKRGIWSGEFEFPEHYRRRQARTR